MTDKWIVAEVDGRISAIAADYRFLAWFGERISLLKADEVETLRTYKISTERLLELGRTLAWEDLRLFGSAFQKQVWKTLMEMPRQLVSYSDLAALCDNPQGVRAVAHAVALNPLPYIIPCHLVVPKESIDRVKEIRTAAAESTLFKGSDLYLLDSIGVGEYAWGPETKRAFIKYDLSPQ